MQRDLGPPHLEPPPRLLAISYSLAVSHFLAINYLLLFNRYLLLFLALNSLSSPKLTNYLDLKLATF